MFDNESPKPPTDDETQPNETATAKAQREREEMLAYIQWSGDGGNNLD
jgi:hypothetical protein